MAAIKTNKQSEKGADTKTDSFWRKPITLDSFDDEDPLAALYRGREVDDSADNTDESEQIQDDDSIAEKSKKTEKSVVSPAKSKETVVKKKLKEQAVDENIVKAEMSDTVKSPTVSPEELKDILKIKTDSFQFTDLREILRGKSFEMYAYLRFLSGETGVCKIKHLDLMKKLDISRPTLFKQGDWLVRLSLIGKSNVPGDHLGTSYSVQPLENVLPVSESLLAQLQTEIEKHERDLA